MVKIGDTVQIVFGRNITSQMLIGFIGVVEKESVFNEEIVYWIRAQNDGPKYSTTKEATHLAWKKENITARYADELSTDVKQLSLAKDDQMSLY